MKKFDIFKKGITVENPIFVLLLGLCSALAITTTLTNAIGMGLAVTCVLILANVIISLLRKVIPSEIRIPVYIVIIATLVKCVQLLMNAYMISLYNSLGVFIPLIVVNCIILGRAESFASKNTVLDSLIDALGMGVGYTLAILAVSFFRELIGTGGLALVNPFDSTQVIFQFSLFKEYAIGLITQPAGAFLTLGTLIGVINSISNRRIKKATEKKAEVK
ncbi:electron transport complex subunit RsxE [Beduini massiliensis]|uniref:electron transport complex subunit RsxE n=1 Tax=Beduini massiliensis TaxID=1585974 RepID=UPI00059A9C34|nr:electron transport complex subunit E [Beduini massiliensis]